MNGTAISRDQQLGFFTELKPYMEEIEKVCKKYGVEKIHSILNVNGFCYASLYDKGGDIVRFEDENEFVFLEDGVDFSKKVYIE